MIKLIGNIAKLAGGVIAKKDSKTGEAGGLISLIQERSGKISFRRSVPVIILGYVGSHLAAGGELDWKYVGIICVAGAIYIIPQILNRD